MSASRSDSPAARPPAWWTWSPVALLLGGIFVAWSLADAGGSYPFALRAPLQFVFMTLASWITAYYLVRSFLATGAPGLAMISGGVLLWGVAPLVAGAIGRDDTNVTVTIHNLCMWVAAGAQLVGAVLGSSERTLAQRGTWALGIPILAMCVVSVIAVAAVNGFTPTFFVETRGGTLVRQTMLGSAIAMLLLSAAVLSGNDSRFAYWYRLALILIAIALLAVMLELRRFGLVGLIGQGAQWLAGVYMVVASLAAARESRAHRISLAVAPSDARLRYGLALVFVAGAWAIRLLFFRDLGSGVPYILFFPAVMLAALYGGTGPSLVAATLAVIITNWFWRAPGGQSPFEDPAQWLASVLFYADCVLLILVARAVQNARERAAAADAERRYAQRAEQVLRDADRRKDAFLAMLSHEIRNALAPLGNSLDIMERAHGRGDLADTARATMYKQVAHLNRIVDDLLDISRITRDKLELRTEPVELAGVIRSSMDASQPLAARAGHTVTLTAPPAPVFVQGDAIRLAQVFTNLLNNACKYTERGGRIEIELRRDGGDAVVSVRDNGIGLAPDQLAAIFEPFTQVDRSIARSQGGLGIGLSLARRLVEMHGGALTAKSDGLDRGSEFVATLPAMAGAPPSAPQPAHRERPATGRRILVADDNRDNADTFASLFRMTGNDVATAYDGPEAVRVAEQFRPEIALLDIGMPGLDGYEVCRRIRAQPWGKTMMLIAHTGWSESDRAEAAGFDGHLTKPADYAAFAALLERATVTTSPPPPAGEG